jgi:hypothetical protein
MMNGGYFPPLNQFNTTLNSESELMRRVAFVENQLRNLTNTLNGFYLLGRLRTDRTAPVNSADVQTPDMLYDRVLTADYEYILINNSGIIEWRQVSLSSF